MPSSEHSQWTPYVAAGALGLAVVALWKMLDNQKIAAAKAETELLKQKMEMMQMQQQLQMQQMQMQMQQQQQQQQQRNQPDLLNASVNNNSMSGYFPSASPNLHQQQQQQQQMMNNQSQLGSTIQSNAAGNNFSITQDAPTPIQQDSFSGVPPPHIQQQQQQQPNSGSNLASLRSGGSQQHPGQSSLSGGGGNRGGGGIYPDEGPPTFTTVKSSASFNREPTSTLSLQRNASVMYRDDTSLIRDSFTDVNSSGVNNGLQGTMGTASGLGPSASQAHFGSPGGGVGNSSMSRPRSDSEHRRGENQTANDSVADFLAKKRAMNEVKMDLLRHVSSFRGINERFLEKIVGHLQHESYQANDTVCTEGEYGDCMYFVASGTCEGWRKGKFFKKFTEGHYFGEVALLRGVVRSVTVRALSQLDLFYLQRDPFLEALAEFPEVRDAMEKEVIMRYEEAKYSANQRRDPLIRKKIEENVRIAFEKMKAQFSKKMKWQLNQKIGAGAAGDVYSAINLGTGQPMAVKVLPLAGASRSLLLSVQQESEMMQRLHHANLVQGYGLEKDEEEGHLYIFMELLPMGSIQKVLKEFGPMSETATRTYAKQMLQGLQYLHEHGILHRDIKPANMLISAQGTVKLADFGISRYGTSVSTQTITGTPAYMSPDAINGKYSVASDIWALGCSILEMITRQVPWNDLELEGPTQLIFHIATCNTTPTMPKAYDREAFARAASQGSALNESGGGGGENGEGAEEEDKISPMLYDLLLKMMSPDPQARGDCASLLEHEWFHVDDDLLPSQPHRIQQLSSEAYGDDDNYGDDDANGANGGTARSLQAAFSGYIEPEGSSSRDVTPAAAAGNA